MLQKRNLLANANVPVYNILSVCRVELDRLFFSREPATYIRSFSLLYCFNLSSSVKALPFFAAFVFLTSSLDDLISFSACLISVL
jgi:hypothetical protein